MKICTVRINSTILSCTIQVSVFKSTTHGWYITSRAPFAETAQYGEKMLLVKILEIGHVCLHFALLHTHRIGYSSSWFNTFSNRL